MRRLSPRRLSYLPASLAIALTTLAPLLGCQALPTLQAIMEVARGGPGLDPGFQGLFEGNVEGAPAQMDLSLSGSRLEGRIVVAETEYRLVGGVSHGRLQGRMTGSETLQSWPFEAHVSEDQLMLLVPGGNSSLTTEPRRFLFRRVDAAPRASTPSWPVGVSAGLPVQSWPPPGLPSLDESAARAPLPLAGIDYEGQAEIESGAWLGVEQDTAPEVEGSPTAANLEANPAGALPPTPPSIPIGPEARPPIFVDSLRVRPRYAVSSLRTGGLFRPPTQRAPTKGEPK